MCKVLYVHPKSTKGRAEVEKLQRLGRDVVVFPSPGGIELEDLKSTQDLLIIFCGGAEERVAVAPAMLRDAVFCHGENLADAVQAALTLLQTDRPITACSTKPLWK
jgi:hypothetical protein